MRNFTSLSRRLQQLGQGTTEYLIIVALIVIAAIGVYSFFGQSMRQQDAGGVQNPPGKGATKDLAGAQDPTGETPAKAGEEKGPGDHKSAGVGK